MIPLKKLENANNFIATEIKSVVAWEEGGEGQDEGSRDTLWHDGYGMLVVLIMVIIFLIYTYIYAIYIYIYTHTHIYAKPY